MKIPLFDIDGILFKTGNNVHSKAFAYAFKTIYGINATKDDAGITEGRVDNQIIFEVLKIHGLSERKIKGRIKRATEAMAQYFELHKSKANPEVLPGVRKLLQKLKKNKTPIGVLTGNVEKIAWTKLKLSGLKSYFEFGAFGDKVFKRVDLVEIAKQNAEKVLGRKVETRELFIIGDTPRDIKCARDAGIKVIAVATGIYSYEELVKEKPDLLVHTLEEEKPILDFISF